MASCPKCGRRKVKKNKRTGLRHCKRCGVINKLYYRNGVKR